MKNFIKSIIVYILTLEAAILIKRHKPTIIAVTGSVGKTSTKDAIFAAIKNNVSARKSEKSFNSDIGVPLTVLGLPSAWNSPILWIRNIVNGFFTVLFSNSYPKVLVLEIGIDRPGDMDKVTKWIKPDIVVLTRLPEVPVHVEYFSSPKAVIEEKMKLVTALKPEGTLVYNADDQIIVDLLPEVLQKQIGFSRYRESNFTAKKDKFIYKDDQPVGVEFEVKHNDELLKVAIADTVGTQHMYSCLAALAVASELEISTADAVSSLAKLQTPNGRMKIVAGIKSAVIIDDTYNSSPIAAAQAIQALHEVKYAKRKIAVLGDMLELGKYSAEEHKRIGAMVPEAADVLFTLGIRARQFAEAALAHGMSEKNIFQYDDVPKAGRELQNFIKPGDVILVKASQGIRAERVVEEVMADPDRAPELLVRNDANWQKVA